MSRPNSRKKRRARWRQAMKDIEDNLPIAGRLTWTTYLAAEVLLRRLSRRKRFQ